MALKSRIVSAGRCRSSRTRFCARAATIRLPGSPPGKEGRNGRDAGAPAAPPSRPRASPSERTANAARGRCAGEGPPRRCAWRQSIESERRRASCSRVGLRVQFPCSVAPCCARRLDGLACRAAREKPWWVPASPDRVRIVDVGDKLRRYSGEGESPRAPWLLLAVLASFA